MGPSRRLPNSQRRWFDVVVAFAKLACVEKPPSEYPVFPGLSNVIGKLSYLCLQTFKRHIRLAGNQHKALVRQPAERFTT
jgi:hypothetical protein